MYECVSNFIVNPGKICCMRVVFFSMLWKGNDLVCDAFWDMVCLLAPYADADRQPCIWT
jgi:hypothetical protein